MRLSSNGYSHTHNHQTIWAEEMCTFCLILCRYAVYLLILPVQCDIATVLVLLSAWIRYAGTSRSLSKGGAYSLIIIGQVGENPRTPSFDFSCFLQALSAISQPV